MTQPALDELNAALPIVAHESIDGADCCGCVFLADAGGLTLRCNECGKPFTLDQFRAAVERHRLYMEQFPGRTAASLDVLS